MLTYLEAAFRTVQEQHLVDPTMMDAEFYTKMVDESIDSGALDALLAEYVPEEFKTRPMSLDQMVARGLISSNPLNTDDHQRAVQLRVHANRWQLNERRKDPIRSKLPLDEIIDEIEPVVLKTHMGLSPARVISTSEAPVKPLTEFQQQSLTGLTRTVVGDHYLPLRTWKRDESVLEYLTMFSALEGVEVEKEAASRIYLQMMHNLKQELWVDGRINRTFAIQLDAIGYRTLYLATAGQLLLETGHGDLVWDV